MTRAIASSTRLLDAPHPFLFSLANPMKQLVVTAFLAAFAGAPAFAADCSADIAANDIMQFDKKAIAIPKSCKTFKVTLTHTGKLQKNVMGHNWVLAETVALQAVATDGAAAGAANNYVKPGDARVLAATKVIGGGEKDSVDVDVSKLRPGTAYSFFCTFPGHPSMMKGAVTLAN